MAVAAGARAVSATATRPRALALGRAAAVLAAASVGVHLLLLEGTSLGSLVMLGMAVGCLPCAVMLWRAPTGWAWRMAALVDAAMLAVHAQLLAGSSPAMPGMAHGAGSGILMWCGLALVGSQLALAALAGLAAVRRRPA